MASMTPSRKVLRRAACRCTIACCRTAPTPTAFDPRFEAALEPVKLTNTLAFMFETRFPQHLTHYAATLETLQQDYADCWAGLPKKFDGKP